MILAEETNVIFASRWNSGMLKTPQLHIVERILFKVTATLSWSFHA